MRLKYEYRLDTWARGRGYDSKNSLTLTVSNYEIEFTFDDNNNVIGMSIFIPNAGVMLSEKGTIDASLDKKKEVEVHSIANYIANILYEQTGRCKFDVGIPEYVPETEEERRELEGKTFTRFRSFTINAEIGGFADLSQPALSKYFRQKDALAMYVDARKMTNPTGKFREFFRVLDHYFAYEGTTFDREVHNYLVRFDSKYSEDFIEKLRNLRNRCSHAKTDRDYITSNDLEGMKEIQSRMGDIQGIAKLLIENPPRTY